QLAPAAFKQASHPGQHQAAAVPLDQLLYLRVSQEFPDGRECLPRIADAHGTLSRELGTCPAAGAAQNFGPARRRSPSRTVTFWESKYSASGTAYLRLTPHEAASCETVAPPSCSISRQQRTRASASAGAVRYSPSATRITSPSSTPSRTSSE